MSEDIVTRLRAVLHNDRSVELMNHEAAEEIMQLRQQVEDLRGERDEARRLWCEVMAASTALHPEQIANRHGWDCFKETP